MFNFKFIPSLNDNFFLFFILLFLFSFLFQFFCRKRNVVIKSTLGLDNGNDLSEKVPVCNDGLEKDISQCQQKDQKSCLTNGRVEIDCSKCSQYLIKLMTKMSK